MRLGNAMRKVTRTVYSGLVHYGYTLSGTPDPIEFRAVQSYRREHTETSESRKVTR